MTERTTGWAFVAAQVLLLGALIVSPAADHWPTPGWLLVTGRALVGLGIVVGIAAALRLGSSLTPTPVPTATGTLRTEGLYRWVRHPIYTGVLMIVAGITIPSGSLVTAAIAAVTVAFFTVKARWEEQRLRDRFPDYARYAARTPQFLPRPGRRG